MSGNVVKFVYKPRRPEDWNRRVSMGSGSFEGFILDQFPMWTTKKGDNWIRILPPTWPDPRHYGLDVWVHYNIGPDHGAALCLQKHEGQRCPICEARSQLERAGDEDEAIKLKPTRRVLVWLIDRNEETKGPVLWAMPSQLDLDIVNVSKDRFTGEHYNIDDPEAGHDVAFTRDGEGLGTRYRGVAIQQRPSSVHPKYMEFVQENPLPKVLRWRNADEISALYQGRSSMTANSSNRQASARPAEEPPRRFGNGDARGDTPNDSRGDLRSDDRGRDDRFSRDDDRGRADRGRDDRSLADDQRFLQPDRPEPRRQPDDNNNSLPWQRQADAPDSREESRAPLAGESRVPLASPARGAPSDQDGGGDELRNVRPSHRAAEIAQRFRDRQ